MQHLKASYMNSVGMWDAGGMKGTSHQTYRRVSEVEREERDRQDRERQARRAARRSSQDRTEKKTPSSHFKPARRGSNSKNGSEPAPIGEVKCPLAGRGGSQSPSNRDRYYTPTDRDPLHEYGQCRCCRPDSVRDDDVNMLNSDYYTDAAEGDPFACAPVDGRTGKKIGLRDSGDRGKRTKVINNNWF